MQAYQPIDCTFYDYIEYYSMKQTEVLIQYTDHDRKVYSIRSIIIDTINDGQAEYIKTKEMTKLIRLDMLISINEHYLSPNGHCKI